MEATKETLARWKNLQKTLLEVPKDSRSTNHWHYLNEINGRVNEEQELLKYKRS